MPDLPDAQLAAAGRGRGGAPAPTAGAALVIIRSSITPEQWTAALEANGFCDVRIVPDIAAIRDVYPSFVVAAVVASKA